MWPRAVRAAHIYIALLLALSACKKKSPAPAPQPAQAGDADTSWINADNRAVGLMERFDFDGAAQVFASLVERRKDRPAIEVNWAIALFNRRGEGDSRRAMQILDGVLARRPNDLRAIYCKGLLLLSEGNAPEALQQFRKVTASDPADAFALCYSGQCLAAQDKHADALADYERAISADPLLRSAYYGAFQSLQQLGRTEQAQARLDEFMKLADNPRAQLAEFKYTRMGKKAEARPMDADHAPAVPPPAGPLFAGATPLPIINAGGFSWRGFSGSGPRPTITVADIDGDGRLDLFITSALLVDGVVKNAVLFQREGGFEVQLQHPLASVSDVNAAVWGDFDNDGLLDVYLCRHGPNQLWRQMKPGQWQDITEAARASGGNFNTIDAAALDADQDGDLDLLLVRSDGPTELLSNNRDGTFRPIGEQAGIAGDGRGAVGLLVADLNHDGLVDLVVLKSQPPHDIYLNDRLWKYRIDPKFDELRNARISTAVAADLEADGQVSIITDSSGDLLRWRPDSQGVWRSKVVAGPPTQPAAAVNGPLAIADVSGRGKWDLLSTTKSGWSATALPDGGPPLFNAASDLSAWCVANLDPSGGLSVVGLPAAGGPPLIWKRGPGRYPFAALALSGRQKKSDSMRSNASGIGVLVAARADSHWTVASTFRNQSGPGQSLQPLSIGLGGSGKLDFVQLTWPDGLRQTELDIPAGKLTSIAEVQRQTSSCPVIFVWDGKQYAFVTDCLGVGGIGFAVAPGEYAPLRPWENVLLPEQLLAPKDGKLVVKIGEPMEEACYLDSAALISYDLPAEWHMTLDERMGVNDPQPTGQPRFYRKLLLPVRAVNDRGQDVTAAIKSIDAIAAEPGRRDPRFIGFTAEHSVELTFDEPIDAVPPVLDSAAEPMLLADGWIEYPYSQTMIAAWQARALYRAPTLEACGPDGKWVAVLDQFGYPAGMPRQMSVPIPRLKLPAGATRLRLRTNQEIYWDRLAIAWAEPCPQAMRRELPMKSATLAEVGFPLRTTGPQRRPQYDYQHRLPLWDTRWQAGWYTAWGRVDELLRDRDDACAIFGPGEEVQLAFAAPAPPPPAWTRRYVLELGGWCKDRDLYTRDGLTLGPLPARPEATPQSLRRRDELHQRYNTRLLAE